MKLIQIGNIACPGEQELVGAIIEATPDELRSIGHLMYKRVDVVEAVDAAAQIGCMEEPPFLESQESQDQGSQTAAVPAPAAQAAPKKKGRLLAIEGIDGSGKTTLATALADKLRSMGAKVYMTREPTNESPDGKMLREAINSGKRLPPRLELAAFIEDRRWHVENVINPRLEDHDFVITDRYYMSTVVYQEETMSRGDILNLVKFAPCPIWIYIEIDPHYAMQRVMARGKPSAFENFAQLSKFSKAFDELFGHQKDVIKVSGNTTPDVNATNIANAIALHDLMFTDR